MSLLIPGRSAPRRDIDVYLQPLIKELKNLWEHGVQTYDASNGQIFRMHAAVMWTINNFPAYGNMSGWNTKGYLACPNCNNNASSQGLRSKIGYMGARRHLPENHTWRTSKLFNGQTEHRSKPLDLSGDQILEQIDSATYKPYGKHPQNRKRQRNEHQNLNWNKRSIMFDLPYWKTLKLRHNLDVMHIEKNICDNVVGTLLSVDGKNKDTDKARLVLEDMKIRKELHLKRRSNGSFEKPPALYTLSVKEREGFCDFLKSMKYPDGYAANISNCVTAQAEKLFGLKSHDSHVLIQRLLPIGMRGYLNKEIGTTLFELGNFFKQLCSKTLRRSDLHKLDEQIVLILYEEAKQASDHLGWGTSCFLLVGDTAYNGNQLESDPIRSAIINSCIRVFFIFTLYNTSNHNDQLKLGASSPEEAALHADQNPGDVGSPRNDWQSLSEALERYSSTAANISASTDQQTVQDWKIVPGLKTGRLRKKTLTQPETDSPAAIPLGSPVAPSPVLPVRSNVEPSHHVTSQPMVDSDETQAPSETQPSSVGTSKPLRVRGPTLGKGIQKIIRAKKREKCYVHIDRGLNAMTGKYATPATNELGIQIRTLCPLKDVKSWLDLDETTKAAVIQAVLDKFQIGDDFHNDLQAQEIVNKKAYGLYKDWRYTLKQEFELLEGLPRDEIYAHPPVGVSLDDWKHLIDVKRSKAGKSNRSQLPYNHTNGSRSFPIAMAAMVAKNGDKRWSMYKQLPSSRGRH
ncbi:unnamed protein product [Camellia sinensis]